MEIVMVMLPIALGLGFLFLMLFLWANENGQFDDLTGPAHKLISDDDGFEKQEKK